MPAGLELRPRARTLSDQQALPRLTTAGHIIEIVGTQGIGKSTLCNDLQKRLKDRWLFRSDLTQIGPTTTLAPEIEELHRKLYFQRVRQLEKKNDAWDSIIQSRQAARVISENLTVMTNSFPRGFIFDEGLFKNFPREVLKNRGSTFDLLWTNRALIHLRARDASFVVARYTQRARERAERGLLQRIPDQSALRSRIETENALFDEMMAIAKDCGCATLLLHAEDKHEENITRILEFERVQFAMVDSTSKETVSGKGSDVVQSDKT